MVREPGENDPGLDDRVYSWRQLSFLGLLGLLFHYIDSSDGSLSTRDRDAGPGRCRTSRGDQGDADPIGAVAVTGNITNIAT
jgi:hypothetical protein